jgi:hypothetical protein
LHAMLSLKVKVQSYAHGTWLCIGHALYIEDKIA